MSFEHDKRIIIYPNYLDNRKTVAQGRCIPKELACESPNALEIVECITNGLKLEAEAEMKSYPRDWMVPGRVRVKLKNDDGTPVNPDIPTRRALMLKVVELVARHPGRVDGRPKHAAQRDQQAAAAAAKALGVSSQQASAAGGSSKKKSAKKGGR